MISSIFLAPLPASRYFRFVSFAPNIKVVGRIQLLIGGWREGSSSPCLAPSGCRGKKLFPLSNYRCKPCCTLKVGLMALGMQTGRGWACGFVCSTFREPGLSHVIYGYSQLPSKDRVRLLARQPPASI